MEVDKPVIPCHNCGLPIRIVSPGQLEQEECLCCGADLTDYLEKVDKDLESLRITTFLSKFFENAELITPSELADFLKISNEQVRVLARKGKLDYIAVSDEDSSYVHRRFLPVHVLEFLERESSK